MKIGLLQLGCLILGITCLHAIKVTRSSTIKGYIFPETKVKDIWAVQGKDSTLVSNEEGGFKVKVKPGTWKIIICTNEHDNQYKVLENIETNPGQKIDLGTIILN